MRDLNLPQLMLTFESKLIERALRAHNGAVTRTAASLGLTHQGLTWILENRHRALLPLRKEPIPRPKARRNANV